MSHTDRAPFRWGDATPSGPALTERVQRVRARRGRPEWLDLTVLLVIIGFFAFALGFMLNGVIWSSAPHSEAVPAVAVTPDPAPWDGTMPGCRTEDDTNCFWDAEFMGNGSGRSFIDWGGRTFYAED